MKTKSETTSEPYYDNEENEVNSKIVIKEPKLSVKEEKINKLKELREAEKELERQYNAKEDFRDRIIDDVYLESDNYIEMVIKGNASGFIFEGEGGFGKTYSTLAILKASGREFIHINSHLSAIAVFALFCTHPDKIFVFDDVAKLFKDDRFIGYLKAGLWGDDGIENRRIHNRTMKPQTDEYGEILPSFVDFTGGIIILTNYLNKKNLDINALVTRVNYVNLKLDYDKKIAILEKMVEKPHKDLTITERKMIFEFIKNNTQSNKKELNLRTLVKVYQIYVFCKEGNKLNLWRTLAERRLKTSFKSKPKGIIAIEQIESDFKTLKFEEKALKFEELTGLKRNSYARWLRTFKDTAEE